MTLDTTQPDFAEDADATDVEAQDAEAEDGAVETAESGETPAAESGAQDRAGLIARFAASPEGQALQADDVTLQWADRFLEQALDNRDLSLAEMTPDNLREVLFQAFPAQVVAQATDAPAIIREIRAFWQFLERADGLPNAAAILQGLDDRAARRLEIAMSNPADYSPEKAFMMGGIARGFDMTTDAGRAAWAEIHEAEQATRSMQPFLGAGTNMLAGADPDALAGDDMPGMPGSGGTHRKAPSKSQQKAKRKMAQASQRKNRKK